MCLTGVEVSVETLKKNIEPNTVLVVISDENGQERVFKVDHQSIAQDKPFLKVTAAQDKPFLKLTAGSSPDTARSLGGCWKRNNGQLVWVNPCR